MRIKFVEKCAGREAGVIEEWADETQAKAFVDSGAAVVVRDQAVTTAAKTAAKTKGE
jgi:hypothetical protein